MWICPSAARAANSIARDSPSQSVAPAEPGLIAKLVGRSVLRQSSVDPALASQAEGRFMAQPPPLSPVARWVYIATLAIGALILVVEGIHIILAKNDDIGLLDSVIGGGAAGMVAVGAIMLFHRPDR
jgi:hypothetical protein